jgi:hypothetical protein
MTVVAQGSTTSRSSAVGEALAAACAIHTCTYDTRFNTIFADATCWFPNLTSVCSKLVLSRPGLDPGLRKICEDRKGTPVNKQNKAFANMLSTIAVLMYRFVRGRRVPLRILHRSHRSVTTAELHGPRWKPERAMRRMWETIKAAGHPEQPWETYADIPREVADVMTAIANNDPAIHAELQAAAERVVTKMKTTKENSLHVEAVVGPEVVVGEEPALANNDPAIQEELQAAAELVVTKMKTTTEGSLHVDAVVGPEVVVGKEPAPEL